MSKNNIRKVILNGDDFGYSEGVNKGILEALENGILTSTSVMVYRPATEEAKELSKLKNISVGLHLDVTEEGARRWTKILSIFSWKETKIRDMFNQQVDRFERIVGRLPDHIDSHHHVHQLTRFKHIVYEFANKYSIPIRSHDATFVTKFYGRSLTKWNDTHGVTPDKLIKILKDLPHGVHEIMCHPGYVDEGLINSGTTYLYQREAEVKALTSHKVKNFVKENVDTIKLVSWKDI